MAHRMETAGGDLEDELFVLMTLGDDRAVRQTYIAGEPRKEVRWRLTGQVGSRSHAAAPRGKPTSSYSSAPPRDRQPAVPPA